MSGMEFETPVNQLDFPDLDDSTFSVSLGLEMDMDVQSETGARQVEMIDPTDDMSTELILVRRQNLLITFAYINVIGMDILDLEDTVTTAIKRIDANY